MNEANFEWNEVKDLENKKKHGISFYAAQYAFLDKNSVIAEDVSIAKREVFLRFDTLTDLVTFEFLVPVIGARVKKLCANEFYIE